MYIDTAEQKQIAETGEPVDERERERKMGPYKCLVASSTAAKSIDELFQERRRELMDWRCSLLSDLLQQVLTSHVE